MSTYAIPRLEFSGSPYQIGLQHGKQLAPQIRSQLAIYRALFQETCKFEWGHVRSVAEEFRGAIARLAPELLQEMEGIVDGVNEQKNEQTNVQMNGPGDANGHPLQGALGELEARVPIDVLDIIALNARSEIALGQWDDGCTSLAWRISDAPGPTSSPGSTGWATAKQILAQNWDWRESVGKNLAMVSIAGEGKPKIWMVIEPGIVGKIGFNEHSVGVCLNAIRARPISTALLPIHLLLRLALQQQSLPAAVEAIETLGGAASSQHILIADAHTGARGLELSPRGGVYLREDARGVIVHTNHFLANRLMDEPPWLSGSPVRLARAQTLVEKIDREREVEVKVNVDAKLLRERVFADTFNAPQAICCEPDPTREARIQTLFNIVMTFGPARQPSAEVVFGRPGSREESVVYHMPW
ncbi:AAT-domain-containing protein [Mycena polygramma]|nr:AAT-domain-containing protein [Mycena polygramma]